MSATRTIKRSRKKKSGFKLIPESLQAFIARRFVDILAAFFGGAGFITLLALISYNHEDPSWNTASLAENAQNISNWGGAYGAWISDLLIQTLGAGGFALALGALAWGVRLYYRQALRPFSLRIIALIIASLLSALAFSQVPSNGWAPHAFLGGGIGTLLIQGLNDIALKVLPAARLAFLPVSALGGLLIFGYAIGMTRREVAAIFGGIKNITLNILIFFYNLIMGFIDWVQHHNDPQHYQPKPLIKLNFSWPKLKRPAKTAVKTPPPVSNPAPAPMEAAPKPEKPESFAQQRIPVVTAQAAQSGPESIGQQRFHLGDGDWQLPDIELLDPVPEHDIKEQMSEAALRKNAELLQNVLADFNVEGDIVAIHPGPVVTLYELEPAPGTKTARVISIADDIARSMSAISVRCAVIPGRNVIGIELPNKNRQFVYMREMLESGLFAKNKAHLPLILGKDIGGQPVLADLAKMPHLLVAGTTGSGKSVAVNTMILSLIYRLPPEKCRMIMIDPKMLELSVYDGIPHLLSPVVTEPGKAIVSLKWTVNEMEERYRAMSKLGVRNIEGYNERIVQAIKNGETIKNRVQTGFAPETGKPTFEEQDMELVELPYIVVIVDEFADLMLVAGKDVENAIQRLAQMARAAGIHLIMATQRPSVDVITGVIKANFPTRISFAVTSKIDSRTILGEGGAEQLLGMGDMLHMAPGGRITRVHGPFVSDQNVEKVVDALKAQGEPSYISGLTDGDGDFEGSEVMNAMFGETGSSNDVDELYDQAVAVVARERKASTSFIQRHLQIGYNRAARIVEEMERQGVISPATATGKREVLVSDHGSES